MEIFTSYFGNVKKILKACPDAFLVSIAGKTPDWFNGVRYSKLAPRWDWWKEWHSMFENRFDSDESVKWYTEKYISTVLNKTSSKEVIKDLMQVSVDAKITVLLCYEIPEKFCHRKIVSDWLKTYGILCKEWKNEDTN